MAATLAIVLLAISVAFGTRALYAPTERIELDFTLTTEEALPDDSFSVTRDFIDTSGRIVPWSEFCDPQNRECVPPPDIRQAVYYHPPSRYWRFQWTEAALLLTLSLALGVLAVRRTAPSRI
jgi:hypothetical protein